MTSDIATALAMLIVAVLLFITGRSWFNIVTVLVPAALAAQGPVIPGEALPGFGNLAVVAVWEVLTRSGSLVRTEAAALVGN